MASIARLLFKQTTYLKRSPVQSSELPSNQLQKVPVGTLLVLQSYGTTPNNHLKLSFKDITFKGSGSNWYVFTDHVAVLKDSLGYAETIDSMLSKQFEKNVVKILVDRQTTPAQGDFLKLVVNQDTVIKRLPVQANFLSPSSLERIPAGTELVLATDKPDVNNTVQFPLDKDHVKFSLRDVEFDGYTQGWYGYVKHLGIQRLG